MFRDESVEIWNLTDRGMLETACQNTVTVVGRIEDWGFGTRVRYSLNGGPQRPVAVYDMQYGRLCEIGDFAIDTITRSDLREGDPNVLDIEVQRPHSRDSARTRVTFFARRTRLSRPCFELSGHDGRTIEEVGQVVEGRWQIDHDSGGPTVRIAPGDEGYDRIMLFGDDAWQSGYELITEFTIDDYPEGYHSFGPVFRWRPHVQGNGDYLPREWTSALAIFSSGWRGLTLRTGFRVGYRPDGSRTGHTQHAGKRVSMARALRASVAARAPLVPAMPEFPAGKPLRMTVVVRPGSAATTIEPVGWTGHQRRATVSAEFNNPSVASGAVGFLAAYCSPRIHRFDVRPIAV